MTNLKQSLESRIVALEHQQKEDILSFKQDIQQIFGQINPLNIIKNVMGQDDDSTEGLGNTILSDVIGISTGYISKKVMFGSTNNPFKKLMGTLFQFAVAKFVSNHSEKIHAIGEVLVNKLVLKQNDFIEEKKASTDM
jgi:hypothetical protein